MGWVFRRDEIAACIIRVRTKFHLGVRIKTSPSIKDEDSFIDEQELNVQTKVAKFLLVS